MNPQFGAEAEAARPPAAVHVSLVRQNQPGML